MNLLVPQHVSHYARILLRSLPLWLSLLLFAAVPPARSQEQSEPEAAAVSTLQAKAPSSGPAATTELSGFIFPTWQFSAGYQYTRWNIRGALPSYGTNGISGSAVRFFGHFLGVEGDAGYGWGGPAPGASLNSLFIGGGGRLALHTPSRFEPWAHGLIGVARLPFHNVDLPLGSNSFAWELGGGVDYRIRRSWALRFEGDYLGTSFGGGEQRNLQISSGVVLNF